MSLIVFNVTWFNGTISEKIKEENVDYRELN